MAGPLHSALATLVLLPLLGGCAAPASEDVQDAAELVDRGDAEFDRNARARALEKYRLAAYAADQAGDEDVFVEASAQVATVLALQNVTDEARTWLERAELLADPSVDRAWSRVLLARGVLDWRTGDMAEARGHYAELYNYCMLRELTPRAIQAASLASLVTEDEEQIEWARRAIQAASTTGEPQWEAPLWANLGWLLEGRGLHAQAVEAFARARSLTRQSDAPHLARVRADWAYGHGLAMAGRFDEARRVLDEALALAQARYMRRRTPQTAEYFGRVLSDLARCDAAAGRIDRALSRLATAREKLVEAGAVESAPELLGEIDERAAALQR